MVYVIQAVRYPATLTPTTSPSSSSSSAAQNQAMQHEPMIILARTIINTCLSHHLRRRNNASTSSSTSSSFEDEEKLPLLVPKSAKHLPKLFHNKDNYGTTLLLSQPGSRKREQKALRLKQSISCPIPHPHYFIEQDRQHDDDNNMQTHLGEETTRSSSSNSAYSVASARGAWMTSEDAVSERDEEKAEEKGAFEFDHFDLDPEPRGLICSFASASERSYTFF